MADSPIANVVVVEEGPAPAGERVPRDGDLRFAMIRGVHRGASAGAGAQPVAPLDPVPVPARFEVEEAILPEPEDEVTALGKGFAVAVEEAFAFDGAFADEPADSPARFWAFRAFDWLREHGGYASSGSLQLQLPFHPDFFPAARWLDALRGALPMFSWEQEWSCRADARRRVTKGFVQAAFEGLPEDPTRRIKPGSVRLIMTPDLRRVLAAALPQLPPPSPPRRAEVRITRSKARQEAGNRRRAGPSLSNPKQDKRGSAPKEGKRTAATKPAQATDVGPRKRRRC